eukprot:gene13395-17962_t
MEGLLSKKNSKGIWKDRFCKLTSDYFTTYKPKGKKASNEVKESIEILTMDSISVILNGVLQIKLNNGEILLYKGGSIDLWEDTIRRKKESLLSVLQEVEKKNGDDLLNPYKVHLSGILLKKSHNKYQGFQERFVKVVGTNLHYFKSKGDDKELGSANLETAEFVRPYDQSVDCKVFEVQDANRVFIFQTATHNEMMHWVDKMEAIRQEIQVRKAVELEEKIKSETPIRIRIYDEQGEQAFIEAVVQDLNEIYPDLELENDITLRDYLGCASNLLSYLEEFIPETHKTTSTPYRHEILATMMIEVNKYLALRMLPIFTVTSTSVADRQSSVSSQDRASIGSDNNIATNANKIAETRHKLLENATIGDLHGMIDWITKYQLKLRSISCPTGKLPNHLKAPKSCKLFESLHTICSLYVYGGSTGAKGGAASHLFDHCNKVWEGVLRKPEEMLQRHQDGTFFTDAPIGMWEAINQHIQLATSTQSPILHVMIADKVVDSLNKVITNITDFVQNFDRNNFPAVKEIELEFFSALANDTALHIEEVIELIENFQIAEIRQKIDDIFDSLTANLVACGQACLHRLAKLVMIDVQSVFDEVFMPEWLEGNQVHTATATISDYMSDFQEFLVNFWAEKFNYTILEEVIVSYIRSILFRKNLSSSVSSPPITTDNPNLSSSSLSPTNNRPVSTSSGGFFSTFFSNSLKEIKDNIVSAVASSTPSTCDVDADSLGQLAHDVNTLNAFFSQKASQDVATEFLELINEVSLMLFLDVDALVKHVTNRISEFPSAAEEIFETASGCLKLRHSTVKKDLENFKLILDNVIENASALVEENENNNIVEGKLGLLYHALVPRECLKRSLKLGNTLAQKQKNMSKINLHSLAQNRSGDGGHDEEEEEDDEAGNALLDDVMDALNEQNKLDERYLQELEEARLREEESRAELLNETANLFYEGNLEKKSAGTGNLWQKRWFKLTSRDNTANNDPNKPFIYHLMWLKKENGSVIKSIEIEKIVSMCVVHTTRPMAYVIPKLSLMLQSEVDDIKTCLVVKEVPNDTLCPISKVIGSSLPFFYFSLTLMDGKEHFLRATKVDRILKWMNVIAKANKMGYDEYLKIWTKDALPNLIKKRLELAAVSASTKQAKPADLSPSSSDMNAIDRSSFDDDRNIEHFKNDNNGNNDSTDVLSKKTKRRAPPPPPRALDNNNNKNDDNNNGKGENHLPKLSLQKPLDSITVPSELLDENDNSGTIKGNAGNTPPPHRPKPVPAITTTPTTNNKKSQEKEFDDDQLDNNNINNNNNKPNNINNEPNKQSIAPISISSNALNKSPSITSPLSIDSNNDNDFDDDPDGEMMNISLSSNDGSSYNINNKLNNINNNSNNNNRNNRNIPNNNMSPRKSLLMKDKKASGNRVSFAEDVKKSSDIELTDFNNPKNNKLMANHQNSSGKKDSGCGCCVIN